MKKTSQIKRMRKGSYVKLIKPYYGRYILSHIKDLKKGDIGKVMDTYHHSNMGISTIKVLCINKKTKNFIFRIVSCRTWSIKGRIDKYRWIRANKDEKKIYQEYEVEDEI